MWRSQSGLRTGLSLLPQAKQPKVFQFRFKFFLNSLCFVGWLFIVLIWFSFVFIVFHIFRWSGCLARTHPPSVNRKHYKNNGKPTENNKINQLEKIPVRSKAPGVSPSPQPISQRFSWFSFLFNLLIFNVFVWFYLFLMFFMFFVGLSCLATTHHPPLPCLLFWVMTANGFGWPLTGFGWPLTGFGWPLISVTTRRPWPLTSCDH